MGVDPEAKRLVGDISRIVVEEVGPNPLDEELDGGVELAQQWHVGCVEAPHLLSRNIEHHLTASPADVTQKDASIDLAALASTKIEKSCHQQTLHDEGLIKEEVLAVLLFFFFFLLLLFLLI
jgi:hypothetical protein